MKKFKFIDLFSGLGGFRIALERLGGECVFSCDIDNNACDLYELNFGVRPKGDITAIETKNIPKHDILCGGFPCQPFSIAGKRLGFQDERNMFFEIIRIAKDHKPKVLFLENVKGLLSNNGGKTFKTIVETIESIGYDVFYKVLNAKDYGIPQNRERVYFVCFRKDLNIKSFDFPAKKTLEIHLSDLIDDDVKDTKYYCSEYYLNLLEKYESNLNNSDDFIIINRLRKSSCLIYKGVCPCLTASMGISGNNIPIILNYKRKLTERECLRIMGFPENYKLKENVNHSKTYVNIGNSIVLPVLEMIAKNILKSYEN